MINIQWEIKAFEELTVSEIYEILHLRSEVFVVEQKDAYLDPDGKDRQGLHLLGMIDRHIVAYCRLFPSELSSSPIASFGRVLIVKGYRRHGIGRLLVQKALDVLNEEDEIRIAAQLYLQSFYKGFGFESIGESYLDGAVEHIEMFRRR